jgi:hypothetical protein
MEDINLDSLVPTQSKYLTKEDAGEDGINLTIAGFKIETVGQGADADERCVLHFAEAEVKPMVINKTNMNRIKHVTKAETTGQACGKLINVYNDPMVEFGGKLTGGLRIRPAAEPANPAAEPAKTPVPPAADDLGDIPF